MTANILVNRIAKQLEENIMQYVGWRSLTALGKCACGWSMGRVSVASV
jgi:hypothetical protein